MCLFRKQCYTFTDEQDTSRPQKFACMAQKGSNFSALGSDRHFNPL